MDAGAGLMGHRPTTKKVNGRWYDINQAADRIAELEGQLAASRECHILGSEDNARRWLEIQELEQRVEALTAKVEARNNLLAELLAADEVEILTNVELWERAKVLATAQQEGRSDGN